jgi:hypothetical protein
MLPLDRFIIPFGSSELLSQFRNTPLITFFSAIFKARDLIFQPIANVAPLRKSHLVISQSLEWYTGRVQLRRQRSGKRAHDIIQKAQPIGDWQSMVRSKKKKRYHP